MPPFLQKSKRRLCPFRRGTFRVLRLHDRAREQDSTPPIFMLSTRVSLIHLSSKALGLRWINETRGDMMRMGGVEVLITRVLLIAEAEQQENKTLA